MINNLNKRFPRHKWGDRFISSVRPEAEKMLEAPISVIPYSEFLRFYETGSRVEYEQLYMEHRKRLWHFVAMALYEEDAKWITGLSDVLTAICSEFAWTFPAHVNKEISYRELYEHIDLFAAETAQALGETLYLLSDRLPGHIVDMVKKNLEDRIVAPYIKGNQNWPKNNWQAVCNGCIAICMIELSLHKEFLASKKRIVDGLNVFLDSYPEDGICLEGALYWAYGFGYFVYSAAMIREYTNGEIDFFKSEKVKNIAHFYEYAFVSDEYTVPFADAGHVLYLHPGLVGFLHKEYSTPLISEDAATKYGYDLRWRLPDLIRDFFWNEGFLDNELKYEEKYFPDACWYFNRKQKYTLVAKGGHNAEPHNHNDIGSFVVFTDKHYVVDDLGWPEYDKNYFNPLFRYKNYICTSSLGHSVPIINSSAQLPGADMRGVVRNYHGNVFELDISAAYGLCDGSAIRTIQCFDDTVVLSDKLRKGNSLVSRIALRIEPEIIEDGIVVGESKISSDRACKVTVKKEIFETRYSVAVSDTGRYVTAYLVDFEPQDGSSELKLTIKI